MGAGHVPGECAVKLEAELTNHGIPVSGALLGRLRDLAERFNLEDRLQV